LSSLIDIEKLTPDQRLDLIGELWDSLDHSPIELAEDVRALLDQRIAEMEQDPSGGLSLDEVLADLTRARVRR
jgi:putative addiction module component (TIGR02574 family)